MPTPTNVAQSPGQAARQPRCASIAERASANFPPRASVSRRLAVFGCLQREFEDFASAHVPRRDPAHHDELDQPLRQLPDCQPGPHRVAQMVSGTTNVADLDIEKYED